jgi:hypothetical protein
MALASIKFAKSVVQLSESPLYHYQYSSLSETVSNLARTSQARAERHHAWQRLLLSGFKGESIIGWQIDAEEAKKVKFERDL